MRSGQRAWAGHHADALKAGEKWNGNKVYGMHGSSISFVTEVALVPISTPARDEIDG